MSKPWTEVEQAGSLVVTFDGIDADLRDAAELQAFKNDLATPVQEKDDGGSSGSPTVFDRRPTGSPTAGMRRMFLIVLGVVTGYLSMWGGASLAHAIGVELNGFVQLALFFIGVLTPAVVATVRAQRARPGKARALPRDRFTLRLDASGLSITGERSAPRTFGLDSIDGFEPGRRLALRKADGTREDLSCALPMAGDHVALAARLDAALTSVRAGAAGYRGAFRGRISDDEVDEDETVAPNAERSARR